MTDINNCFNGLSVIIESAFPKKCALCGKTYLTAEQFLIETHNMPNGRSSLKEALEDDGTSIVEVFRNCACGSTLMDEFSSRRDDSSSGNERRAKFDKLLILIQHHDVPVELARTEIRNLFKGQKSKTMDSILTTIAQSKSYD